MHDAPRRTGDFGIGRLVHVIHMTDDVPVLRDWYRDVFGGLAFLGADEPTYFDFEDRWASLLMVGDLCVEPMAPNLPPDPTKPVARFFLKYGRHLHSVGYKVDDLAGLGRRMIGTGIAVTAAGGRRLDRMEDGLKYLFPHPRDTFGLMAEMVTHDMRQDPRLLDTWPGTLAGWQDHPLTLRGLADIVLGVRDLDAAVACYVDRLQAVPVRHGYDEVTHADYQLVRLGDSSLRIVQPTGPDSHLGEHVARYGNMIYGITLRVTDLDAAEAWLTSHKIRTSRPTATTLAADPEDTFGAPYFLTTTGEGCPGQR